MFDPKEQRAPYNSPKILRISNLISKYIHAILKHLLIILMYNIFGQWRALQHHILMWGVGYHPVKFGLLSVYKLDLTVLREVDQLHGLGVELDEFGVGYVELGELAFVCVQGDLD